jgi:hypothetical protein
LRPLAPDRLVKKFFAGVFRPSSEAGIQSRLERDLRTPGLALSWACPKIGVLPHPDETQIITDRKRMSNPICRFFKIYIFFLF